jgi:hypothetical protein
MKRAGLVGFCVLLLGVGTACSDDDADGDGSGGSSSGSGSSTTGSGASSSASGGSGNGAGGAGGAADSPCTITWSGAASGTADCTDSASSKFIGVMTAATVGWQVNGDTADHKTTFQFSLAKPPAAMTYDGTEADDQFCTADFLSTWSANSKMPAGCTSCSITLDSVVDDSSGSTSTFIVHGTATATLLKGGDPAAVTLDVTF